MHKHWWIVDMDRERERALAMIPYYKTAPKFVRDNLRDQSEFNEAFDEVAPLIPRAPLRGT